MATKKKTKGKPKKEQEKRKKCPKMVWHMENGDVLIESYQKGVIQLDMGSFYDIRCIAQFVEDCFQCRNDFLLESALRKGEDIHEFHAICINFLGVKIRISERNCQKERIVQMFLTVGALNS